MYLHAVVNSTQGPPLSPVDCEIINQRVTFRFDIFAFKGVKPTLQERHIVNRLA